MRIKAQIEKQISDEYYDERWYYMNHAGYNEERDNKAFKSYRTRRLKELGVIDAKSL